MNGLQPFLEYSGSVKPTSRLCLNAPVSDGRHQFCDRTAGSVERMISSELMDDLARRTDGASPAFIKEFLLRIAQHHIDLLVSVVAACPLRFSPFQLVRNPPLV